jgi:predicted membrane protein
LACDWELFVDAVVPSLVLRVADGFVLSVGFDPDQRVWRYLFGPLLAWPLLLMGYGLLLRAQQLCWGLFC